MTHKQRLFFKKDGLLVRAHSADSSMGTLGDEVPKLIKSREDFAVSANEDFRIGNTAHGAATGANPVQTEVILHLQGDGVEFFYELRML